MKCLLNKKKTSEKTGLSLSTIYRLERKGLFPSRRQISIGRVGWLEAEIDEWILSRGKAVREGGVL